MFIRMANPDVTLAGRFIILAYQWALATEGISFFMFSMIYMGFDYYLVEAGNLTLPLIDKLEKGDLINTLLPLIY